MEKRVIFSIIAVVIILAVAFFSQQAYSKDIFKKISDYIGKYAGASLLGAFNPSSSNNKPGDNPSNTAESSSVGDNNTSATNTTGVDSYKVTESGYNASIPNAPKSIGSYIANKVNMAVSGLSENVGNVVGGLKSGGEAITNTIANTKENISDAGKKIENYFSGIANSIAGKNNNTCETQPAQTPAGQ